MIPTTGATPPSVPAAMTDFASGGIDLTERMGKASHATTNEKVISQVCKNLSRPLSLLDMGCGKGYLLSRLAEEYRRRGWDPADHLVGVDIDLTGFSAEGIPHREVDLNKPLPFEDGSLDIVLAVEVLEHTRAPYLLLEEVHRVLRPGGMLIFSVPNVMHALSRVSFLFNGHYHLYPTPSSDPKRGGTLAGHIEPLPLQYWHYGLRYAGFAEIATKIDRSKRGAIAIAVLLWPALWLSAKRHKRHMTKYSAAVAEETRGVRQLVNSWEVLTGRSLIVSARQISSGH